MRQRKLTLSPLLPHQLAKSTSRNSHAAHVAITKFWPEQNSRKAKAAKQCHAFQLRPCVPIATRTTIYCMLSSCGATKCDSHGRKSLVASVLTKKSRRATTGNVPPRRTPTTSTSDLQRPAQPGNLNLRCCLRSRQWDGASIAAPTALVVQLLCGLPLLENFFKGFTGRNRFLLLLLQFLLNSNWN